MIISMARIQAIRPATATATAHFSLSYKADKPDANWQEYAHPQPSAVLHDRLF